jgi:transposase
LKDHGFGWVVSLSKYLDKFDWSGFESRYNPSGRKPLHPKLLLGLILYGLIEGIWSLRGLEKLSAKDLCANYLSAGQIPDHSTIGKFILRHEDILSEEFFQKTLHDIAGHLNLKFDEVSGDGTVIEARASHYKTLKEEALGEVYEQSRRESEANPESSALREKAECLGLAKQEITRRAESKKKKGKDASKMQISPLEPEAVIQPLKTKACRPSYKPLIFTNQDRFIAHQSVVPSNEASGAVALLETYKETTGQELKCGLFDAGFHTAEMLVYCAEHDLDLLTPAGRAEQGQWRKRSKGSKKFVKQDFSYDRVNDVYICPQGLELKLEYSYRTNRGELARRYRGGECSHCTQRERCTSSSRGRTVLRYEFDELKEAMDQVMQQPGARQKYKKRQGMVEPVFGYLRDRQHLRKFHRFGLKKVRLEFALHAIAYNLGRAFKVFGMLKVEETEAATGKKRSFTLFFALSSSKYVFAGVFESRSG